MSSAGLADHEGLVKRFVTQSTGLQVGFRRTLRALGADPSPDPNSSTQPPQLIRFFTHEGYYTVHGRDAFLLGDQYFGGRSGVYAWGEGREAIPTLCVSRQVYEHLIPHLLTVLGCSIEQYETRPGTRSEWVRIKLATPGNIAAFAELIEASPESVEAPTVLSVILEETPKIMGPLVHAALLNTTTRTMGLVSFQDDRYLTLLSALLHANNIRECVRPVGRNDQLDVLLGSSGVSIVTGLEADYTLDGLLDTVKALVGSIPKSVEEASLQCRRALAALISRLGVSTGAENENRRYVYQAVAVDILQVSAQDAQTLGLFPGPGRGASLATTVNRCVTAEGRQMLGTWLRQPLTDARSIEARQDAITALVEDPLTREALRQALRILPAIGGALGRIASLGKGRDARNQRQGTAGRRALSDVSRLYLYALRMKTVLDKLGEQTNELLKGTCENLLKESQNMKGFEAMVETVVDLEALAVNEYAIKSEYNEELAAIRSEQTVLREKMMEIARSFEPVGGRRRSPDADEDSGRRVGAITLTSTPSQGYFLRGGKTILRTIKGKAGVTIIENGVNLVKFVTPALRSYGTKYEELQRQCDEVQATIVQEVVRVAVSYIGVFSRAMAKISAVDALCSLAAVASEKGWVRPRLVEGEQPLIDVQGLRHPILESIVDFIPNDVSLGIGMDGTRGSGRFMVLTGPNMGGKTTYLKSIALCVLLAQIGSFIPCASGSSPSLSIFGRILVRAGAGDSVNSGRSTFMNEMVEMSSILSITELEETKKTPRASLVLIDELGRGTSTHDGYGLSYAIAKALVSRPHALTVFATHIHQLITLEKDCEGEGISPVSNYHASAEVDPNGIVSLTYTIRPGANKNSYGIQVAKMAGYPPDVLQDAETRLKEYKDEEKRKATDTAAVGSNLTLLSRLRCTLALYISCRKGVGAAGVDEDDVREKLKGILSEYHGDQSRDSI